MRTVIVTGKYFTLGGWCGPGIRTAVAGLLFIGFTSCLVWGFLRHVSIIVSHNVTRACACPCFREYFSLRGCCSPGSYQYFQLLYHCRCDQRLFYFGRVYWCGNEQCYLWCCHSFELGIGPMVLLGWSLQYGCFL